jgi:hypothetical protein
MPKARDDKIMEDDVTSQSVSAVCHRLIAQALERDK